MKYTLVTYRTKDRSHNEYAIIPTIWLSDLLDWLKLSEAVIVKVTSHFTSALVAPIEWPSYRNCSSYVQTVLILETR